MPGLDIRDFIGSILNWSELVEVLYMYEYLELRDCNEYLDFENQIWFKWIFKSIVF